MRRPEPIVLVLLLAAGAAAVALPPPLQSRIDHLPAALQHELHSHDATWNALTQEQQQALRARMAAWDALPEARRRQPREHWQAWKSLLPQERLQVQAAADRFAALPIARQQALRAGFAQLDATTQHGWLLGPALGADYATLQPLLLQVPPGQREPLLAVLRAMTPGERADLGRLARRSAPAQRDELRRALLSTSAANRAAWLQSELER